MTWQFAIGLSIVMNAVTNLVQRRYSQKSTAPHTFPPTVSYVFGVLPVGYAAALLFLPHHIYWSRWLVILLVLEGVVMAISNWTGFKASSRLAVAPYQTMGMFSKIVVVLLGWTVLAEKLTMYQFIGATILLTAALLAVWAPTRQIDAAQKQVHLASVALTLISATTLGIGLVTEKAILGHMEIGGGFLVGWSAQAIAMIVLAAKDASPSNLRKFKSYEIKWSVLMGLANGLTGVFYVYAIVHSDNVSLITTITAVALPLTIAGAYFILKEREKLPLVWTSVALSFIGLLVIGIH